MATARRRPNLVEATRLRITALEDPDIALVALAYRAAELLSSDETASAALMHEYRATMATLTAAAAPRQLTLDDLIRETQL